MTQKARAKRAPKHTTVRSVVPCLTFKDQAEEAVKFYVSVIANSGITSLVRSDLQVIREAGTRLQARLKRR